jgi:hypothetical protein
MTLFNLFRRKPDPITVPPGEIHVDRQLHAKPYRDVTVITYGGHLTARQKMDIEKILKGTATAHLKPNRRNN